MLETIADQSSDHSLSNSGGLDVALGTIVGIMSHFTTLKIAIVLNWIVVADWCS